jgi:dTDP-4-dehydrorhamnose 3,5-epimerase
MTVQPLALRGVALVHGVRHADDRGVLRKVLVADTARRSGLDVRVEEVVTTVNEVAGTVRGMHYQVAPHAEAKTLWVTDGRLYDVLVDLRPDEPTFGQWVAVTLSAYDDVALHVPEGVAHGYQTLEDGTRLTYLIGTGYSPEHARTLLWNDPLVGISWPAPVTRISERDQGGHAWPPRP